MCVKADFQLYSRECDDTILLLTRNVHNVNLYSQFECVGHICNVRSRCTLKMVLKQEENAHCSIRWCKVCTAKAQSILNDTKTMTF